MSRPAGCAPRLDSTIGTPASRHGAFAPALTQAAVPGGRRSAARFARLCWGTNWWKVFDCGRARQRRFQIVPGQPVCLFPAGTPDDFQLLVSADLCRFLLVPGFSGAVPAENLA